VELRDLPDTVRFGNSTASRPSASRAVTVAGPAEQANGGGPTLAESKQEAEVQRILEALEKFGNNRVRAAAELGISRMALYKKLHKYGLMGGKASPPSA
jgi:DNA-binding NtrC family response regulator